MIRGLLSMYSPKFPTVIVYMLQSTEYEPGPYIKWFWRTKDFNEVMHRRQLDSTRRARLLLMALSLGIIAQIIVSAVLVYLGFNGSLAGGVSFGLALFVLYPVAWAHLIVLPLMLAKAIITGPQEAKLITDSERIFANHKGVKIAVAGSYGKTTMKELLATVLGDAKKVAMTPGNKNVSVSHARFAAGLKGDEDVLIIEYGEGAPGDVAKFAGYTHPDIGVITGLAPAHLDHYKTLQAAGEDIFSLAKFVPAEKLFVNADSPAAKPFIKTGYIPFNLAGLMGWKTKDVKVSVNGTSFTLYKGKQAIKLSSRLVGRHQVGFLAFAAVLAHQLGLSLDQVASGIAKTVPYEHRMQPYELNGAWIIDDTYNGNLEGIRAGTALLAELPGKRKIYITPGLVDQGEETESVHKEIGKLIAKAKPDMVILMKNSATSMIQSGLEAGDYKGQLQIQDDPLDFYTNLKHFVAAGDLVVMQNDWTDNYS